MLKYLVMLNKVFDNFIYYLTASLTVFYLELVLALRSGFVMEGYMILGVFFCAFSFGALICLLSSLFKSEKINRWIYFALTELITIFYMIEFFCNQTYNTFMNLNAISNGAGNVVNEYMGIVLSVIKNGLFNIFLFEIPAIILLVCCIKKYVNIRGNLWGSVFMAVLVAVMYFSSNAAMTLKPAASERYTYSYMYNDAVHSFGLAHGTWLDIRYSIEGVPAPPLDNRDNVPDDIEDETERNELDIDWEEVMAEAEGTASKTLLSSIKSRQGSNKNEYTGIFEGKNLVVIAVESMSKEMITEQFFPLMYRMMTKGIVFEDYYTPFWGGSTTTGEAAILTGIIPMHDLDTMQLTLGNDNSYTMASMLTDQEGYFTAAYHNGTPEYYNRINTHPGLGFSKFDSNASAMGAYLNF